MSTKRVEGLRATGRGDRRAKVSKRNVALLRESQLEFDIPAVDVERREREAFDNEHLVFYTDVDESTATLNDEIESMRVRPKRKTPVHFNGSGFDASVAALEGQHGFGKRRSLVASEVTLMRSGASGAGAAAPSSVAVCSSTAPHAVEAPLSAADESKSGAELMDCRAEPGTPQGGPSVLSDEPPSHRHPAARVATRPSA